MKRFAEFWHNSTGWNGTDFSGPIKLIPACGSDSVLPLDARLSYDNQCESARAKAKDRGFPAFRIMAGDSFTHARPVAGRGLLATEGRIDTLPAVAVERL